MSDANKSLIARILGQEMRPIDMLLLDLLHAQYVKDYLGDVKAGTTDLAHALFIMTEMADEIDKQDKKTIKMLVKSCHMETFYSDIIKKW